MSTSKSQRPDDPKAKNARREETTGHPGEGEADRPRSTAPGSQKTPPQPSTEATSAQAEKVQRGFDGGPAALVGLLTGRALPFVLATPHHHQPS